MMTSIQSVTDAVTSRPGHTAYWYNTHSGCPVRQNWCYEAFARAVKANKIIKFQFKSQTVYFPVTWTRIEMWAACNNFVCVEDNGYTGPKSEFLRIVKDADYVPADDQDEYWLLFYPDSNGEQPAERGDLDEVPRYQP